MAAILPDKKMLHPAALVFFLTFAALCLFSCPVFASEAIRAPQFTAVDVDGQNFLFRLSGHPSFAYHQHRDPFMC